MWDLNEKIYGRDRNKYYDDIMTDVTFFSGLCYSCAKCKTTDRRFCESVSLSNITRNFRTPCQNLLMDCKWNGQPFECCQGFIELHSEFGVCFTINSLQTLPKFGKKLQSNRESGPGQLEFIGLQDVELYLHPAEDIPSKSTDRNLHETILWGSQKTILFGVQEIINEEDVPYTTIEQRRCRFSWELSNRTESVYEYYSYSTCMVDCSILIQLDTCGCVHHLIKLPTDSSLPVCTFDGLVCLTENYGKWD